MPAVPRRRCETDRHVGEREATERRSPRPPGMPSLDLRPRDSKGLTEADKKTLLFKEELEAINKSIARYLTMRRGRAR